MNVTGPIVLVEDDEDDIFLITTALDELRLENSVKVFRNGHDALDYLQETNPTPVVIISDVNMPVMNGFELLDALLTHRGLGNTLPPFVLLTTSDPSAFQSAGMDSNRIAVFTKGYSYKEISETLLSILEYSKSGLK